MTLLLIFIILCMVLGWHFVFAFLGGVFIIGAAGIFIAIASIVIFCIGVLLLLSSPALTVGLVIGVIFAFWTLFAIIIAPILFPIVLPLFIIYAVLAIRQRRNNP